MLSSPKVKIVKQLNGRCKNCVRKDNCCKAKKDAKYYESAMKKESFLGHYNDTVSGRRSVERQTRCTEDVTKWTTTTMLLVLPGKTDTLGNNFLRWTKEITARTTAVIMSRYDCRNNRVSGFYRTACNADAV